MLDDPLRPICDSWISKIRKASEYKQEVFGKFAEECMDFFNGPYDGMYGNKKGAGSGLTATDDEDENGVGWQMSFKMNANKVAEMVQLFGPALYQKNPQRTFTPRDQFVPPPNVLQMILPPPPQPPNMPMGMPPQMMQQMQMQTQQMQMQMQQQMMQQMQQQMQGEAMKNQARSALLDAYLNYTPRELGLKDELRQCIDEAIIKGLGCAWVELMTMPTGIRLVGTTYDSVDNLIIDPDPDKLDDCKYIARRCYHPVWEVEREYGLEPGSLRPQLESWDSQAEYDPDHKRRLARQDRKTNDIFCYWKIWSKMGIGGRLEGLFTTGTYENSQYRQVLERYGDYCYIVVAANTPYPLNLPPQVIEQADDQEIMRRLQWPIPTWADKSWPMSPLMFHEVPRQAWPASHCKFGMGELKFLNWAYSFLASKVRITSREFLAIMKSTDAKLKAQLQNGMDLTVVEVDMVHQEIGKVCQFLQHPPMNRDLLDVIEMVGAEFEKRTGLNELMYGESARQMRSAQEAEVKQKAISVRPDDMRNRVEDWCGEIAKKEAIAARALLTYNDIAPILGPIGAQLWQQLVSSADLTTICHQIQYDIEADSTRKPNREKAVQNMAESMKNLFGPLLTYSQESGDIQPINSLIGAWAKTLDMDPSQFLFKPPPPPPQPDPTPPPSMSVSLKGEDVIALGLAPAIQQNFGVPPSEPKELPSSEAALEKAKQKPAAPKKAE